MNNIHYEELNNYMKKRYQIDLKVILNWYQIDLKVVLNWYQSIFSYWYKQILLKLILF